MIKQYDKKDGTKAWMFKVYLGTDASTRKKRWTTRRGFTTKKECQIELNRLLVDVEENGFCRTNTDTFKDVYNLWFDPYKRTVKESTWVKTEELFRLHILPLLGDKRISNSTFAVQNRQISLDITRQIIKPLL